MNVIRARVLGFCMGVRRAVQLASAEAAGRVCTLGPLIHNPQALEELRRRGIETLHEDDLPRSLRGVSVIIRAHGVSPQLEAEIRERGGRIVDATCPRVKASQLTAGKLAAAGYALFLAGEARHAEIAGIRGYVEAARHAGVCVVVGNAAEAAAAAARLKAGGGGAAALIAQTTISESEYRAIGGAIRQWFPDVSIVQTICAATTDRQEALRELLDQVDAVIIAGGKESANTRRLCAIAREGGPGLPGKPCALAETAADIPAEFAAYTTIGLCAGASTPDAVIDDIEKALRVLAG
jgi:4-hydroxy-3-methylbut-2-enyl diphosphate reductase